MRYWKVMLCTLVPVVILLAFSGPTPQAEAQQPPSASNGRFTMVASPSNAADFVLLDTQTGRTWLLCSAKGDSTRVVDNGWCAMRFYGTAPRP